MTRANKTRIGLAAALVAAGLGWHIARPATPLQAGARAPDFELPGLDGAPFRLSGHSGKVVLLNFFASW